MYSYNLHQTTWLWSWWSQLLSLRGGGGDSVQAGPGVWWWVECVRELPRWLLSRPWILSSITRWWPVSQQGEDRIQDILLLCLSILQGVQCWRLLSRVSERSVLWFILIQVQDWSSCVCSKQCPSQLLGMEATLVIRTVCCPAPRCLSWSTPTVCRWRTTGTCTPGLTRGTPAGELTEVRHCTWLHLWASLVTYDLHKAPGKTVYVEWFLLQDIN